MAGSYTSSFFCRSLRGSGMGMAESRHVLEFDVGDRAIAEDHQDGGAEELGSQLGKEGIFHGFFFSLHRIADMADCSRSLDDWISLVLPATQFRWVRKQTT